MYLYFRFWIDEPFWKNIYIYILFHPVTSKKRNDELCMKWIQCIKQTENLPLHEIFFM